MSRAGRPTRIDRGDLSVRGVVVDDGGEDGHEPVELAFVPCTVAGVVQLVLVDEVPVQPVSGLGEQLVEELSLRSAVALAKWWAKFA